MSLLTADVRFLDKHFRKYAPDAKSFICISRAGNESVDTSCMLPGADLYPGEFKLQCCWRQLLSDEATIRCAFVLTPDHDAELTSGPS